MKYQTLGLLFSTALLTSSFLSTQIIAVEIQTTSKIDNVSIYREDGAEIVRVIKVNVPAGNHEIIVSDLPYTIDLESLGALSLNSNVNIISLKTEEKTKGIASNQEQERIKNELEKLKSKLSELTNNIQTTDLQLGFIKSISNESGDKKDNLQEWQSKFQFISTTIPELLSTKTKAISDLAKTRKEIKKLNQELENAGKAQDYYYQARIKVSANSNSDADLELYYITEDATWDTSVTSFLDSEGKNITLKLAANITQDSDENWKNVGLTLSTTLPNLDETEIPSSEFISILEPGLKIETIAIRELLNEAPAFRGEENDDFEEVVVTGTRIKTQRTNFDTSITLDKPITINSDSEAQTFPLTDYQLPVKSFVVTASPLFSGETASLYAETDLDNLEFPLETVRSTLIRDGNYLGAVDWPTLLPDNIVRLPFGEDTLVKVSSTEIPPQDGDTGFFASKRVEEKRYLFTVTNNHNTEQTVEVYDRIPVSAHEDVKVTSLKSATKPTETDVENKPGVIKWVKTLKPGEVWEIRHEYRITYPEKQRISKRNTR
ncbi:mucoidy inhibitor MuiA family protein [Kordiimonas sp. SCSIO 12610]|uniref:mucoidy inhibitor MuiA family protein n=1 Tax=Kordiimonas sp. SCSIO 12610 TaxID=2829597 RepID=UPI00210BFC00|nr:mucoidy inhibitor MuiA family protein [Kordiimonas sp. SCSIO 12610]UTW53813.1 mucoidy inhibitor MuiA family protein [Kordiimonas sp. SCSIO 12610]